MAGFDSSLLKKVAKRVSQPAADAPSGVTASIFAQAARSYGARPVVEGETVPTGFDPMAAALFEGVVEASFLVASADGVLDDQERTAFKAVMVDACQNAVQVGRVDALLADLSEQLAEDGIEHRARVIARTIRRAEHQREVLRIAALMAHISGGVSAVERGVLERLAAEFGLGGDAVDTALAEVTRALAE